MSSRILQVCFKCLRIANFIVTSRKFCIGYPLESSRRPVESSRRPVELLYWTFPRAEDLADSISVFSWTQFSVSFTERVVDCLPLMTYGLKLSLEA